MKHEVEEELVIRRFLLGELLPAEQSEVEERLFLESDYFHQLQAVEDELIDEYLYGDLSAGERERFENYFLSKSERHKDLAVAKALQKYVSKNPGGVPVSSPSVEPSIAPLRKRPFLSLPLISRHAWQFALGAAVLLIAVVGIGIILRTAGPKNQSGAPQAGREPGQTPLPQPSPNVQEHVTERQHQEVANKLPEGESNPANKAQVDNRVPQIPSPARQPPATVYSFLLLPIGPVRGEGKANEIRLAPDVGAADLRLAVVTETEYSRYQVMLQTDDGKRTIRGWNGLRATNAESGKVVSVRVPAKLLRQNHRLILKGVSDDGTARDISSYHFQIIK